MRYALLSFVLVALWLLPAAAVDLTRVERKIVKEPSYHGRPRYALAVFGPEASFKVWLVLDGDALYVDRNADGDLTGPGEKIQARKDPDRGLVFKAGDLTVGGERYTNLEVRTEKLKDLAGAYSDWPPFDRLLATQPEALAYSVAVDVPLARALTDDRGRSVTRLRHWVSHADANGVFQFAERPAEAPVLHFGGPWAVWPQPGQRIVLGRPEPFTVHIGTPGRGPGTLAVILYHTLDEPFALFVPAAARPVLDVQFRDAGGQSVAGRYQLEERC
jgi:hypothetical protein